MNKKYNWPLIDECLRKGVPDRTLAENTGVPLSTLQHHRWYELHIPSPKQIKIMANREANKSIKVQAVPEAKNIRMHKTPEEIFRENAERKRRGMGMDRDQFEVWKTIQAGNPLSAWNQFRQGVRA